MSNRRAAALGEVRGLLFDNWPYKVITLCFAFLTWAWVQSDQVVEDRIRVRLEWTMPDGLAPVETPLDFATVTVTGVQALMRNMSPVDLVMAVDLSNAHEGDVTVDLSDRPVRGLPAELRVAAVAPGTLRVQLDRILKRRLKVAPVVKGEPLDGYAVREVIANPDHVDVTGPSSLVRPMTEVPTEDIDVAGIHEDGEFEVGLGLPKGGPMKALRSGPISVSVKVASTLRQRMFDAVPVIVRGDRWTATVSTVSVTVEGPEGPVAALRPEAVSVIVYPPDDLDGVEGTAVLAGADTPGLRYEVLGVGSPVRVTLVDPAGIHVVSTHPTGSASGGTP